MTTRRARKKKQAGAPLKEVARDAQRRMVLEAAARLLGEGGPEAIQMRVLATAIGASTTVLYSLFGSRDEILAALYSHAVEALGEEFARVEAPHPFLQVVELAYAYRRVARAHPHLLYALAQGPRGSAAWLRDSKAFTLLQEAVARCMRENIFRAGDSARLAEALWATVHGAVTLEVAGYFLDEATAEESFFLTGQAILRGLLVDPDSVPSPG